MHTPKTYSPVTLRHLKVLPLLGLAFLLSGSAASALIPKALSSKVPSSKSLTAPVQASEKKAKMVMCQWFGNGKTQFMCIKKSMQEAQKKCDKYASKQRGDDSKCSCTDDESYIRDVCS